jgi:hypothetical protein
MKSITTLAYSGFSNKEAPPMSEPWTPGPWHAEQPHHDAIAYVMDTLGRSVATVDLLWRKEAEARLLAAAPEMAELLERAIEIIAGTPDNLGWIPTTEALLARIRGVPAPASPSLTVGERGSGPMKEGRP